MPNAKVIVEGENDVSEASDLLKWIKSDRVPDIESVEQETRPPARGEQGPSVVAILGVVLGAKATVEFVKSVHKWIETRKRRIKVTIKTPDGEIIIDGEGPESIDKILATLKS